MTFKTLLETKLSLKTISILVLEQTLVNDGETTTAKYEYASQKEKKCNKCGMLDHFAKK